MNTKNEIPCIGELNSGKLKYKFFDIEKNLRNVDVDIETLPYSLRILAENIIRTQGDKAQTLLKELTNRQVVRDCPFHPARVVLQDLLGTPALVDLAALRDAVKEKGGDPSNVNPKVPTHLVIDHSVNVDTWGSNNAMSQNMEIEKKKNSERFSFLQWCNSAFSNLTIVPPGQGILHQINLEALTPVIGKEKYENDWLLYPDTLVGTDSHTTMINAIGVLGWGVGGIEAEAAMLGKALTIQRPEIVGVYLSGNLPAGYIATDIALLLTDKLRQFGVIGAIVEFTGPGVKNLSLADRATISNMAPEFGATAAIFPIDHRTLDYLHITNRSELVELVEGYARAQGLWGDYLKDVIYDRKLDIDLNLVKRSIAGPLQPHQRIDLTDIVFPPSRDTPATGTGKIKDNSVVIAAITSCTNTSNPRAILTAALLARNAVQRGLIKAPWVKTSFSPGSLVVTKYLKSANLDSYLDTLGFNVVGYGCMTCNGMSGSLINHDTEEKIRNLKLNTVAVTSGNRNFAGRVHPLAREVFIMSPPLVIAYAIAGRSDLNINRDALCLDNSGSPVYLKDIWPSENEINEVEQKHLNSELFKRVYGKPIVNDSKETDTVPNTLQYTWNESSTYIQRPPYWFEEFTGSKHKDMQNMRVLVMLGDNITTDHISPSGAILPESDAGQYLLEKGTDIQDFNSYGTRRGNHLVIQRATFANPRLINELCEEDLEGPYTILLPDNTLKTIYSAASTYRKRQQPLLIIAGKEYGSGSSRDSAAKGPRLLGVRVVLAESFERIHRANLAGMGILPLQFMDGESRKTLGITGREIFSVWGTEEHLKPNSTLSLTIKSEDGSSKIINVLCRLETYEEIHHFKEGGLLPNILHDYLKKEI